MPLDYLSALALLTKAGLSHQECIRAAHLLSSINPRISGQDLAQKFINWHYQKEVDNWAVFEEYAKRGYE